MIDEYKPKTNVNCTVQMKIVHTGETPVFQHAVLLSLSRKFFEVRFTYRTTYSCREYRKLSEKIVSDNFPVVQT